MIKKINTYLINNITKNCVMILNHLNEIYYE
jgi:hypothetical protein